MAKRLTRNSSDAFLGGVASGFAEYFDIDPVIARLAFVLLTFLHGTGVILYLVCWVVMPMGRTGGRSGTGAPAPPGPEAAGADEAPPSAGHDESSPADRFAEEVKEAGERVAQEVRQAGQRVNKSFRSGGADEPRGQFIGGAILVGIGLLFLLPKLDLWFFPHWLNLWDFWPVILIVIGAAILMRSRSGS